MVRKSVKNTKCLVCAGKDSVGVRGRVRREGVGRGGAGRARGGGGRAARAGGAARRTRARPAVAVRRAAVPCPACLPTAQVHNPLHYRIIFNRLNNY